MSWLGPDTDVNDATRSLAPGRVRYSHMPTEPQSWASTCTGRPGLSSPVTAAKSSAKRAMVYAETGLGADDSPTPRLSYRMIRNRSASSGTTPSHNTCESGKPCTKTTGGPSGLPSS